jgi:UDP-N-acetylglucosamine diphosphorylase/glucosamine-1-phosphate N-acetyltransferase
LPEIKVMKNFVLFDDKRAFLGLLPLTFTRAIADLRLGIFTPLERVLALCPSASASALTQNYLQEKYPTHFEKDNMYLNASVLLDADLWQTILQLPLDMALVQGDVLIAYRSSAHFAQVEELFAYPIDKKLTWEKPFAYLSRTWHLHALQGQAFDFDFELKTQNRTSAPLPAHNILIGDAENLFIEPDVDFQGVSLNVSTGAIYIDSHAEIMEGALIRGSLALLSHAKIKMGAKLYGANLLGPYCQVGGELSNVVMQAYSNKGHDGFLGNASIGAWCNLGADTNASNLKNNYASVRAFSYLENQEIDTHLQFCGLCMGDHSKTAINTMLNTGTVVGVCANIFGADFPEKHVQSFTWGDNQTVHAFDKALETAQSMMQRRNQTLEMADKNILKHIFDKKTDILA